MCFCVCKEFLLGKSLTRERSYHFASIEWILEEGNLRIAELRSDGHESVSDGLAALKC